MMNFNGGKRMYIPPDKLATGITLTGHVQSILRLSTYGESMSEAFYNSVEGLRWFLFSRWDQRYMNEHKKLEGWFAAQYKTRLSNSPTTIPGLEMKYTYMHFGILMSLIQRKSMGMEESYTDEVPGFDQLEAPPEPEAELEEDVSTE